MSLPEAVDPAPPSVAPLLAQAPVWAHVCGHAKSAIETMVATFVGMYLRTTQRRRSDGSLVRYVQLAHNRRVSGVTQAAVLLSLGREDRLDLDGLRRLAASITRYLESHGDGKPFPATPGELELRESRSIGAVWLLNGLWRTLGLDGSLAGVLGSRRFSPEVERVVFALTANMALDPCRQFAVSEWASRDVHVPGLEQIDEDRCHHAIDLLTEADVALGYKNLLEVERVFGDLRTTLELPALPSRLEHPTRAQVLIAWLALLMIRVAERKAQLPWRQIAYELGRLHQVVLHGVAGTVVQTTALTSAQAHIYGAAGVEPPPAVAAQRPA